MFFIFNVHPWTCCEKENYNLFSRQQSVMLSPATTTIWFLWYVIVKRWLDWYFCRILSIFNTCRHLNVGLGGVSGQVGQESGPAPLIVNNGNIIRRSYSAKRKNNANNGPKRKQNPRFSHRIIISGANIVNLPVPGVGRDQIKWLIIFMYIVGQQYVLI